MRWKPYAALLYLSLWVTLTAIALSACQQSRPAGTTKGPAEPPALAITDSAKGKQPWSAVPRTGQTKVYLPRDDGDLKAGQPWPGPRFVDNQDDTVTDRLTGLMWTRSADQANGKTDWERAVGRAGKCRQGGHADWRLPNRWELESLLDLGRFSPALPENHPFDDVDPSYYWTSSTPPYQEEHAWIVHMHAGYVTHDKKSGRHSVWYVRGGGQDSPAK